MIAVGKRSQDCLLTAGPACCPTAKLSAWEAVAPELDKPAVGPAGAASRFAYEAEFARSLQPHLQCWVQNNPRRGEMKHRSSDC